MQSGHKSDESNAKKGDDSDCQGVLRLIAATPKLWGWAGGIPDRSRQKASRTGF